MLLAWRLGFQEAGYQETGHPGGWASGGWVSRRLDIQKAGHQETASELLILTETAFVLLSAVGTVFLEWAWAEEAQSHLPAVRWMTIHCPQKPATNVRSMATPNEAGNGEAQTKRTPRTSR